MDCVVGAGTTPGVVDSLARLEGLTNKALLPIAGRPMVAHVVEALSASRYVERIFIVGMSEADGVDFGCPVEYVQGVGSMIDNALTGIRTVLARNSDVQHVVLSASDIPLLTPAIVDRFIEACLSVEADAYYSIVEKSVMSHRFPTSRRTYVKVREGAFCGGDLFLIGRNVIQANQELANKLSEARKNAWKQAMLLGLWTLLKLALGRLSIAEGEQTLSKQLGCHCKVVISPDPELAMDVDKPLQLDIARAELKSRLEGRGKGGN